MGTSHLDVLYRSYSKDDREKLKLFGGCMAECRHNKFKGHKVRSMARLANVNPSTLGLIEKGHIYPSDLVLKRLHAIYDFDFKKMRALLPERTRRGRKPGKAATIDKERWPYGQELFADILRNMMSKADKMMASELAISSGMSVFYVKEVLAGRHSIPPNGVCVRFAKACERSPLRLLLLRMISKSHPEMRRALLGIFFPSSDLSRELGGPLSDRLMKMMETQL